MATVHSTRSCIPKLCCSLAAVGLFIAGILITGAYPHSNRNNFNLNQTQKEQNITSPGNFTRAAQTLAFIQDTNKEIYKQMDKALDETERIMRSIPELAERMSRSTRAVEPDQALDQAAAIFGTYKPKPQYQLSDYATGKRLRWKRNPKTGSNESTTASTKPNTKTIAEWFIHNLASSLFPFTGFTSIGAALHLASGIRRSKRAPSVYPFQITDLLEYEARQKHSQNKILGEKIAKILHQNTDFSDEIAINSQTPSEKLKKDPIMALVTKTISTYMLVKHSKNAKELSKEQNLSPWGEPFFKKKE
jgi:membrane-associated HD superfamily phosphohydrolase